MYSTVTGMVETFGDEFAGLFEGCDEFWGLTGVCIQSWEH